MTATEIAPCIDCGTLTETVLAKGATLGGSGRCGPCQYPIDRPPGPASTPLRVHTSGRLVPACRRCRHARPILGDPLARCTRCAYPAGLEVEPDPELARTGPDPFALRIMEALH